MPKTRPPKGKNVCIKTYRFELHNLSNKKKKTLLQTFKQSEMAYYKVLSNCEQDAKALLKMESKVERKKGLINIRKKLQSLVRPLPFGSALKASTIESVLAQVSSYVELTLSGQEASFHTTLPDIIDYNHWLNELCLSSDEEIETEARNNLTSLRNPRHRPLTFEKYRISDGFMINRDDKGRLFAFLNLWSAKDKRAEPLELDMIDTRENKRVKCKTSTGMLVPLSCSPTQLNALEQGQAKVAKLIATADERFFLMVSVTFYIKKRSPETVMGIDRGIKEIAAYSVRDPISGAIIFTGSCTGKHLKKHQQIYEEKQKNNQKLGKRFIDAYSNYTINLMHHLANEITDIADKYNCQVVLEDLSNLKNNPKMKRKPFTKRNNYSRILSRQQYGRLETLLKYKLAMKGLPEPKFVNAAYTSQCCPACGHTDKNNRHDRSFSCTNSICQYQEHADIVGANNIAGKHIHFKHIKSLIVKGEKLPHDLKYNHWIKDNLRL
ncbi:RNA-guided endonuclease InsQ/TnpB family protein [Vibrio rumoiensis]|uniref:RNA-guided endonuclease InsQ/TnpB family protein n=1 Tax=Vibrio rumoiensis TaxID=76258 RepID=UPI0013A55683|nr:zinc ribbon domain-containing protein [Vibrio rumoiensis]